MAHLIADHYFCVVLLYLQQGKKLGVNLEDGSSRRSSSDEDHVTVINIGGETFGIPQDDLSGVKRESFFVLK